jgi:hypothetical protein
MNKSKFFMVGSDPEAFIRDSSGQLVSAIGLVPGTKWAPHATPHGSIQHDNILAEFNSRPSASLGDFINNHRLIISDLEDVITPLGLHLDFIASAMASNELLSDPITRIAGCEADFDAWRLCANESAGAAYASGNLRAAGGHLHISYDQAVGEPMNRIKMARALDLVLGVPSVIHDSDSARRTLYGKAGSFRPKDTLQETPDPYDGIEYRTLSNFWLRSDDLMSFVYKGVELCYHNLEALAEQAVFFKDEIIHIINTGDKEKAITFCSINNIPVGV